MENAGLYLIKPCRILDGTTPSPTQKYLDNNTLHGIETNIFFDLNILSMMRKVMGGELENGKAVNFKDTFLPCLVELLESVKGFFLSAGLALEESYKEKRLHNYKVYQAFLRSFLPNYLDAYNALPIDLSIKRNKNYFLLDDDYRKLLSLNYASLLCMYDININSLDKTYFERELERSTIDRINCIGDINDVDKVSLLKFSLFLQIMDEKADYLGGVECEIAMLSFFNWEKVDFNIAKKYKLVKKILLNLIIMQRNF